MTTISSNTTTPQTTSNDGGVNDTNESSQSLANHYVNNHDNEDNTNKIKILINEQPQQNSDCGSINEFEKENINNNN